MKLLLPEHAPKCAEHGSYGDLAMFSVTVCARELELGRFQWYPRYEIIGFACCEQAILNAAREQVEDFFGADGVDRMRFTLTA